MAHAPDVEEWRDFPDYEGRVQVSSHGRVRAKRNDGTWYLRKLNRATRYISCSLPKIREEGSQPSIYLHRAVSFLWHGPRPDYLEIRHLDGNYRNNRADNLEYGTPQENAADTVKHGTHLGERNGRARLDERDVTVIRNLIAEGVGLSVIGRAFSVTPQTIHAIKTGRNWSR